MRLLIDRFIEHNVNYMLVCVWVEKCIRVYKFMEHNMELNVWLKFKGNVAELGGFLKDESWNFNENTFLALEEGWGKFIEF